MTRSAWTTIEPATVDLAPLHFEDRRSLLLGPLDAQNVRSRTERESICAFPVGEAAADRTKSVPLVDCRVSLFLDRL